MYTKEQLETIHLQDSFTIQYALLAREILRSLGETGDGVVREATRRFGRDRGRKSREKHLALGVKINMLSLFTICSDLPFDPRFRRERLILSEEERTTHTLYCPMAQVWAQYGAKDIGRMYCEEFHRACYGEYAFGLTQVNLARTLTEEGDEYCDFHVVLRRANVPRERKAQCFPDLDPGYVPPKIEGGAAEGKPGFSSLCVRMYCYLLEVLRERCPDRAEEIMDRGLAAWAEDTAARLLDQAAQMEETLDLDFVERHFPLYVRPREDPLWAEYDRDGALALLERAFYDRLFPLLGLERPA